MRIAVVGSGIAGLGSAWLLSRAHEITLFEAGDYLGGHTHTHDVELGGEHFAVDTGFIVHNPQHYPLLAQLFSELGVETQDTVMSFSVRNERTGLEYNSATLGTLFCQRRNWFSPRFHRMWLDIVRFYREAPALLVGPGPGPTLAEYLQAHSYSAVFRDDHLVPMAAALWSAPAHAVLEFPARFLVRFMANHQMLQVKAGEPWRVVRGGSARYVRALQARWTVRERLSCPVHSVEREERGVWVQSAAGREHFDQLVLACHSDQALGLLADAGEDERALLGAIPYQRNSVVLHTDAALLPRHPRALAAWNVLLPAEPQSSATISYCMNLLQSLRAPQPLIVSLNPSRPIDESRILKRLDYSHPQLSHAALAAQAHRSSVQGRRRTWFAGAYWGFGFHEDGLRSAVEVAQGLGVTWRPSTVRVPEPALLPGSDGEEEWTT